MLLLTWPVGRGPPLAADYAGPSFPEALHFLKPFIPPALAPAAPCPPLSAEARRINGSDAATSYPQELSTLLVTYTRVVQGDAFRNPRRLADSGVLLRGGSTIVDNCEGVACG